MNISKEDWVWYGYPCHFIGRFDCKYHMATRLGGYLVSTIGDWYPMGWGGNRRELGGKGSFFETMVFECPGENEAGDPSYSGSEIECTRYPTSIEAERGHRRICAEYARRTP